MGSELSRLKDEMAERGVTYRMVADCIGRGHRVETVRDRVNGRKGEFSPIEMAEIHMELFPDVPFDELFGLDEEWKRCWAAEGERTVRAYRHVLSFYRDAEAAAEAASGKTSIRDVTLHMPFARKRELMRMAEREGMTVDELFADFWPEMCKYYT